MDEFEKLVHNIEEEVNDFNVSEVVRCIQSLVSVQWFLSALCKDYVEDQKFVITDVAIRMLREVQSYVDLLNDQLEEMYIVKEEISEDDDNDSDEG